VKTDKKARTRIVHARIRRRLAGTADRPRLAVHRTLNHIYAQAIDDGQGRTLTQASTLDKELRGNGGNLAAARSVGSLIASRLKSLGLESVVFDRGGFLYHGRVKALAEAAREAGLKF
jgi:large subunit ribosomal protein L18